MVLDKRTKRKYARAYTIPIARNIATKARIKTVSELEDIPELHVQKIGTKLLSSYSKSIFSDRWLLLINSGTVRKKKTYCITKIEIPSGVIKYPPPFCRVISTFKNL